MNVCVRGGWEVNRAGGRGHPPPSPKYQRDDRRRQGGDNFIDSEAATLGSALREGGDNFLVDNFIGLSQW